MDPFKIFGKDMLHLLHTCNTPSHYLMNWLLLSWPLSLEDFNLYMFRRLHDEFKDLVTSLVSKAEPLSYANLHSHLLTHEFLQSLLFQL
jgi:hypothetical protein